jgi:nitrate ABC transporter ATP-binding subunit
MAAMEALVELTQLGKSYQTPSGPVVIIRDVNLRVGRGEFVCIVGHSGCGKSTLLSILMGLNDATEGGVILDGKEVTGPGTDRGVVFQSPTLLPWMTTRGNVLLALEQVTGASSKRHRRRLADGYLRLVGLELEEVAERYPDALSAGMQQRAGLARAFALEPKLLLLDEPFSLLDAVTRFELQEALMRLWERDRRTVLMVTHDTDEALLLADRIVVMTSGPAATIGAIVDVPFPRPRTRTTVIDHPDYDRLRDGLVAFLEVQARRPAPENVRHRTPLDHYRSDPTSAAVTRPSLAPADDLAIVEQYTGLNRFRARYRKERRP